MKVFLLNTPDHENPVSRDMAGGLGFGRNETLILPPLDLLSYATVLDSKGFDTFIYDSQVETNNDILSCISEYKPDCIIATVSLPTLQSDCDFIKYVKLTFKNEIQIIVKTLIQENKILNDIIEKTGIELIIIGECDLIIDKIITGETREGTVYCENGELKKTDENIVYNLDLLPVLRRNKLKNELYSYSRLGQKITTFQTSRGCPYSCGYYCPNPLVQGKKWRAMSAERIFLELQDIYSLGIKKIFFRDATFTLNRKRVVDLCELIGNSGIDIEWWCETRIDCLDFELLTLMKSSGCKGINVGIETADEQLMTKSTKTGVNLSKIMATSQQCKEIGLKLHFLLMVGFPGETKESHLKTLQLIDKLEPESLGVTTVTPYPGTKFYEDAVNNNWFADDSYQSFSGKGYNALTGAMTKDDLKFVIDSFHKMGFISKERNGDALTRKKELYFEFKEWLNK